MGIGMNKYHLVVLVMKKVMVVMKMMMMMQMKMPVMEMSMMTMLGVILEVTAIKVYG